MNKHWPFGFAGNTECKNVASGVSERNISTLVKQKRISDLNSAIKFATTVQLFSLTFISVENTFSKTIEKRKIKKQDVWKCLKKMVFFFRYNWCSTSHAHILYVKSMPINRKTYELATGRRHEKALYVVYRLVKNNWFEAVRPTRYPAKGRSIRPRLVLDPTN